MSTIVAQFIAWIVVLSALLLFRKRDGIISFPFLYLLGIIFYLLVLPLAAGSTDVITNATGTATSIYYISLIIYVSFYILGVQCFSRTSLGKLSFTRLNSRHITFSPNYGVISILLFSFLSLGLVLYSLSTRNVFSRDGDLLFTILGFDFILLGYLITRGRIKLRWSFLILILITILFLYAGFRYRLALLYIAEALLIFVYNRSAVIKLSIIVGSMLAILFLAAIGQVRVYGNFSSLFSIGALDYSPLGLIAASGEQTLYFATVNVVEKLEQLKLAGFEPIAVLFTHFIPSAIYPDKPRASYISEYLKVSPDLVGTGAAMHDFGQAVLMFGYIGLPFASFLLGAINGFMLRIGLKWSPNIYYSTALLVLMAIIVPSRGYLAQQFTWSLSFILPLFLIGYMSRFRYK